MKILRCQYGLGFALGESLLPWLSLKMFFQREQGRQAKNFNQPLYEVVFLFFVLYNYLLNMERR